MWIQVIVAMTIVRLTGKINDELFAKTLNKIGLAGAVISQIFRLHLLVESFINLRDVSLGVYAQISWMGAIPHL